MDKKMNQRLIPPKLLKKALSILLAVIIGFGTIVSLIVGSSMLQDKLGIKAMLSAYAAEIVDTKNAVSVNEESMLSNHHIIDLAYKDGSNTAYVFTEPISYQDKNGNLKTKDISVEKQGDKALKAKGYDYTNGRNDYRINFSSDIQKGVLAAFQDSEYAIIPQTEFKAAAGAESTSVFMNEKFEVFEYSGAFGAATSLKFYPQLNGIKDEIVLEKNIRQNKFSFLLQTKNCSAVLNDDGTVSLIDDNKNSSHTFSAPFAYDSKYVDGTKDEHYSDCTYSLEEKGDNAYLLTVTVDENWLNSENTVYPVVIDPTTGNLNTSADAGVYSAKASNNYGTEQTCCFGRASDYGYGRVYSKFTMPSAILKGAVINSAYQWERETTGRTTSTKVTAYLAKASWSETGITWSNKAGYNEDVHSNTRTISSKSTDDDNPYWYKFNIKPLVEAWVNGTANNGMVFLSSEETDKNYNWRAFTSKTYSSSGMRPYTTISYTNDTTAPTLSVTASPSGWTNQNVTMTASASDSASGLAAKPYSFSQEKDNKTWGTAKTYTSSKYETLYVSAVDKAGNIQTKSCTAYIDKLAPNKPVAAKQTSDWVNTNVAVTVSAADAPADSQYGCSRVQWYCCTATKGKYGTWNKAAEPNGSCTLSVTSNGTYYFYAKDRAGNISPASDPVTVKIDKVKPVISAIDVKQNEEGKTVVTITAKDTLSGIAGYSFDGGKNYQESNSLVFDTKPEQLEVCVKDNAGNVATDVSSSLPAYYEENQLVGLYNPAGNTDEELQYKIDDGEWQIYEQPFALPVGKTVNVYARIGENNAQAVQQYSSSAMDYAAAYSEQSTDLTIANNDADFEIARAYDSKTKSWFFSTNCSVQAENAALYRVSLPDGTNAVFVRTENGIYENPATGYTLTTQDSKYIVETDTLSYSYAVSDGRLLSAADQNGHSIDFAYENNNLTSISFTEDESTCTYAVEEENGRLLSVTTPLGEKLVYAYENQNLVKVYYDKNTLQYVRDTDIILSEYDYANGLLSESSGSQIAYENGRLSAVTSPVGEATQYSYSVKGFNSYHVVTAEQDFDVIEVKTGEEITCFNANLLPVLSISGDTAVVCTYDGTDLDTETEYTKVNGVYVQAETEEENGEPSDSTENGEGETPSADEPVYTYFEDGETVETETTVETDGSLTITTVVTYDENGTMLNEKVTTVSADSDYNSEKITTYRSDEKIESTVVTTTENGEKTVETSNYAYDAWGNNRNLSVSTVTENLQDSAADKKLSSVSYDYAYDDLGRTVSTTFTNKTEDTTEVTEEYKYNPLGDVIYEKSGSDVTRTVYDQYGRTVQEITAEDYKAADDSIADNQDSYANQNVGTRYYYAPNGNLEKEINPINVATFYSYYDKSVDVKAEVFDLYKYEYAKNGSVQKVYIGGKTSDSGSYTGGDLYAQYNYDAGGNLESVNYGNGQIVSYEYNSFNQVTKQFHQTTADSPKTTQFAYAYKTADKVEDSTLTAKYDYNIGQKTVYSDNGLVTIYNVSYDDNQNEQLDFYYSYKQTEPTEENGTQTPAVLEQNIGTSAFKTVQGENADVIRLNDNELFSYGYTDENEKTSSTSIKNSSGEEILKTNITYNEKGYVESYTNVTDGLEIASTYKYDENGNITEYKFGESVYTYTYDAKGQLIRENNSNSQKTTTYSYDSRGNMKSYKVYDYTTGEIDGSAEYTEQISFSYENTAWLDLADSMFDDIILHDENGNPVSIGDCDIIWTNGRQLSKIVFKEDGTEMLSYTYDDNGIRTSKTYEGKTTYYTTIDGLITSEYTIDTNGSRINEIDYIYNSAGEVIAATYKGKTYYYLKSATGDVVGAANETGRMIGLYQYDGWGNETERFFNTTDADEKHFLSVNPMKYRGYYLDYEMEMYYLQSRYYFAHWCRFFNSDLPEYAQVQKDEQIGTNLFAYCCNNPVNYADYNGDWGKDVHNGWKDDDYSSMMYKDKKTYYGTVYWATQQNYDIKYAKYIGSQCAYVDTYYNVGIPTEKNQSWHFNTNRKGKSDNVDSRYICSFSAVYEAEQALDQAQSYYNKSQNKKKYTKKQRDKYLKKCKKFFKKGLKYIGFSIHPIQDIYAHTNSVVKWNKAGFWYHNKTVVVNGKKIGVDTAADHKGIIFGSVKSKTNSILKEFISNHKILTVKGLL